MVEERDKRRRQNRGPAEKDKIGEKVLLIRRVTKKTPGGNYISFSALVAVGDGQGKIGVGLGRGLEVPQAIRKAMSRARKHMITVPIYKTTLPHDIRVKYKGAYIILKPAPPGAGLKVGSGVGAKSGRGTTRHQRARESIPLFFEGGQNRLVKKFPLVRGKGKNKSVSKLRSAQRRVRTLPVSKTPYEKAKQGEGAVSTT